MFDQIVDPINGSLHNINSKHGQSVINNYRIALKGGSKVSKSSIGGGQKQKRTLMKRLDNDLKMQGIGKKSSPRPKNNVKTQKSKTQKTLNTKTQKILNTQSSKKSGKVKKSKKSGKAKPVKNTETPASNKGKYDSVKVGDMVTLKNGACAVKQANGRFKFVKRSNC